MQYIIVLLFKAARRLYHAVLHPFHGLITNFLFYCNNIKTGTFKTFGIPYISVVRGGECSIGNNFMLINSMADNPIGRIQKCSFFVDKNAMLKIGNNVAMSFTAIYCNHKITIEDNVMIGGGTCIYDTDFHSLTTVDRLKDNDEKIATGAVFIEQNVFIGANCTILKGVTIGRNSIVGACSVVTKTIPANEIWAGNPAKFIKVHTL